MRHRVSRKISLAIAFGMIMLLLVAGTALAAGPPVGDFGGRTFIIEMTGAEEAPGPGDADGSGLAVFTFNPGHQTVCFQLSAENIAPATAAHIHIAPAGEPGPIVVPLTPPTSGFSRGCVDQVSRTLILDIMSNPDAYYVNVHNADFPAGAIRGQFSR